MERRDVYGCQFVDARWQYRMDALGEVWMTYRSGSGIEMILIFFLFVWAFGIRRWYVHYLYTSHGFSFYGTAESRNRLLLRLPDLSQQGKTIC